MRSHATLTQMHRMRGGDQHGKAAWAAIAIAIAIAIGTALRVHHLNAHPFWLDEAYSAFAADKGYAFIWTVLPSYETHPPFYSAALRTWTLVAGNSLLGFRSFGLAAGLCTLPVIWTAGRELSLLLKRPIITIALPALLLAAIIPSFVDVARLVRPYYLMTLVNACGIWSLLRLTRLHRETGMLAIGPWLGYLSSIALLFWLHNLGALYVAGLGLALLILIGPVTLIRNHTRQFLIGHGIAALIALPAFLILLDQASAWTNSTWLQFDGATVFEKLILVFGLPGVFGLLVSILLSAFAFRNEGADRKALTSLVVAALTPAVLAVTLSVAVAPVFLPRTLVASAVPLVLLVSAGAAHNLVSRAAFAMLLAATLVRVVQIQQLPPEQNWYGAVRWLSPKLAPGDRIYAYPNEGALPLRYALRDLGQAAPIRQIPSEIPARDPAGWYPTGSRGVQSLPPWRLAQIAADKESRGIPTIWLLRLSKAYYDKGDSFEKIMRHDRVEVARFTDGDIEIIGLRLKPPPPQQPQP